MKNANRAFALLALINIEKWGRPLTGKVRLAIGRQGEESHDVAPIAGCEGEKRSLFSVPLDVPDGL